MVKNKIILMTGILLVVTLLGSLVSAFGTSYIFDRPLALYPGQTRDIYVTLQNNNDPNTITAKAEMFQDVKVAKMTDGLDTFVVPYRMPVQVNLSFTAPPDAKVGDTYNVGLKFTPQATSEGGMGIVFLTGASIDVLIVERPTAAPTEEIKEEANVTGVLIFIALAIIIIAIILIVLVKKKRKK